jgi:hypothetical protein
MKEAGLFPTLVYFTEAILANDIANNRSIHTTSNTAAAAITTATTTNQQLEIYIIFSTTVTVLVNICFLLRINTMLTIVFILSSSSSRPSPQASPEAKLEKTFPPC